MPIVDEFSRFSTVYFMDSTDMAADLLLECTTRYETIHGHRAQGLHADPGGQFPVNYLQDPL